jgi:hypothetical protein
MISLLQMRDVGGSDGGYKSLPPPTFHRRLFFSTTDLFSTTSELRSLHTQSEALTRVSPYISTARQHRRQASI